MTFTLLVDAVRWRGNAESVRDEVRAVVQHADASTEAGGAGDLVPVAKGNGYGLGNARLAREAARLGVPTLAVGTVGEVEAVARAFPGDVLVMTPYEPADTVAATLWDELLAGPYASRVLRTVASADGLAAVVAAARPERPERVVVEVLTSTGRFGMTGEQLRAGMVAGSLRAALDAGAVTLEGLALHLPLAQPVAEHRTLAGARWHDVTTEPAPPAGATARVREVLAWQHGWSVLLGDVQAGGGGEVPAARLAGLARAATLWLSHLTTGELATAHDALPGVPLFLRMGTRVWLGDRDALVAYGTVLAVHERRRGDRTGYRQRRATRDGVLLVVGGGTSHGVALEAPTPATSLRQRAVAAGSGVLEAGGRALSPFTVAGRQRWFAEPPHMQVSLVQLPTGVAVPAVGDRLACELRLTTATFDQVLGLD